MRRVSTIDEYILMQEENVQPLLFKVREAIKKVVPDAEDRISWSMPSLWKKRLI